MPSESTNVFVSYSHADFLLVSPVVKLLRVNKSLVFQDIDTIQPGKRWRGEIAKGLAESHLVVVFWCTHASQSNEVSKEWQAAIEQKKDLLPLLLDPTPLPPELAEFQWIDFRGTVGANHSSIASKEERVMASAASAVRPKSARSSARRLLLAACAAVFGVGAVLGWFSLKSAWHPKSFPLPTPTATPSLPQGGMVGHYVWSLLFLGIVVAVIAHLILVRGRPRTPQQRRTLERVIPIESSKRPPGDIERHIASELEAEILRRTTLRRGEGR
jgi:hypothetical protein